MGKRDFLKYFSSYEATAKIMGGDVHGHGADRYVMAPALGHSRKDRGLKINVGSRHPESVLVALFNSGGATDQRTINENRDYVFKMHGGPAFTPGKGDSKHKHKTTSKPIAPPPNSDDEPEIQLSSLDEILKGEDAAPSTRGPSAGGKLQFVEAYDYNDANGVTRYRNVRYEPKDFRPFHPVNGESVMGLPGNIERLPYRLDEFSKFPTAPLAACEGEKDVNRVWKLGYCATTAAAGAWKGIVERHTEHFRGREVFILPDFNKTGTVRGLEAATALHGVASGIKIIMLPGLDGGEKNKDVSDWLENPENEKSFTNLLRDAPPWNPGDVVEKFAEAELIAEKKETDNSKTAPIAPLCLTYFDECSAFVDKNEIFKGLLALGETSGWIGPPGSGKSALLTEVSIHCAQMREWRGFKYKAKNTLGVLILALERADLYKRRLHAYALRDKKKNLPIAVASAILDLLNPACVDVVVATVREAEKKFTCPVGIVIIDTYAKGIAANGGDEDKARDQNRAAVHLREIHSQIPVHIALVGHTGKDESRGSRGSNAHPGDADLMNQISSDNEIKVVEITKANDAPLGIIAGFKIELFDLGLDADGDKRQTSILDSNQYLVSKKAKKPEPTGKAKAALQSLFETIADGKTMPRPGDPHVPKSVTSGTSLSHWRCDTLSRGILNKDGNPRQEFSRILVTLKNLNKIGVWEEFVWPVT